MAVKVLHKERPEMSLREIGHRVKFSHNTVKAALSKKDYTEYERPPKVNPELECYHDYICELRTVKHRKGSRVNKSTGLKLNNQNRVIGF